jgi:hypothetical protein
VWGFCKCTCINSEFSGSLHSTCRSYTRDEGEPDLDSVRPNNTEIRRNELSFSKLQLPA